MSFKGEMNECETFKLYAICWVGAKVREQTWLDLQNVTGKKSKGLQFWGESYWGSLYAEHVPMTMREEICFQRNTEEKNV